MDFYQQNALLAYLSFLINIVKPSKYFSSVANQILDLLILTLRKMSL